MDLAWLRWMVPSWLRWMAPRWGRWKAPSWLRWMAPWWGRWMAPWWGRCMAPWWGRWRFQRGCRCPGDARFSTVWGNVWRVVGTEYVRRIMVGIFRGKSRFAEVSPDTRPFPSVDGFH